MRAGQAFYFAEAGVERGLHVLKHHGPGFETSGEEPGKYAYTVSNAATKIPEEAFHTLGLHETATIPLFTDTLLGQKKVKGFLVEFFASSNGVPEKIDVLEWKVYGTPSSGGKNSALADTVALASTSSNASQPSCFGTSTFGSSCLMTSAWINGKVCQGTHARKHYGEESSVLLECSASIQSFMDEHQDNILVLRNIVNPAVISEGEPNVFYRVRTFDDEKLPQLQARIRGTASIGNVTQTIEAALDAQKLQPVFEFAWYGK